MILTELNHLVKGLDPIADAFSGTVYSDVVSMKHWGHCTFIVHWGVGATGTTVITVEACDDFVPTTVSAVTFRSRRYATGDTPGALTDRAVAGFTTTAGSSQVYAIEVDGDILAASGYGNVRLKCVESVDSPILGGILIVLSEPRFALATAATAIA